MKPLPYHENRTELRRELLDASRDYFPATGSAGVDADPALRMASVLGSGYAYNLAAAIEWVSRNVSDDAADGLAAWLSDSLTNGDDDGLNEDLTPAP
ncbi:hypothetical protein [Streptomyces wuyuanensis]|uniref:Uncharacterized protein n=1 Tax=Streptomyces wuyuanensis TaxID=1196353 RepID=A0A1G9ZDH0_9ACTN|nr:hypothetical protein [Streptomyces wuyuanensis]SDN18503.1 hypothetical protein SAMN05444921_12159 [Streptomyces wuyuanensis]